MATSAYAYDGMGRLTGLGHMPTGGTAINYGYTYDAASRVTSMITPDGGTNSIGYDAADQLTGVDYTYQTDEGYAYDANGNRTNTGYSTGAGNQLLSDGTYRYLYDNEGNRTFRFVDADSSGTLSTNDTNITKYEWDYRNRLTAVTHFVDFVALSGNSSDQTAEYAYEV